MKFKLTTFLFILPLFIYGQIDSTSNWKYKSYILPSASIVTGMLLNNSIHKKTFQEKIPKTKTSLDDYLLFAPTTIMYIADLVNIPSRNTPFNQTKLLGLSGIFTLGIVLGTKEITQITRPDDSTDDSFPSGHTAAVFVAGNVLFKEFKETKPLLAYSGLVIASTVGILRMTNNRHWISDVLTSAGIATIVTNLVYHFEPLKNWNPFEKSNVVCLPSIGDSGMGVVFVF